MKVLLATHDFEDSFREVYPELEVVPERLRHPIETDLLIYTGGADVNPGLYGDRRGPYTFFDDDRDNAERHVHYFTREGSIMAKKVLGVCRGLQFLNVMNGGSLYQHLPEIGKGHHGVGHPLKWDNSVSTLLSELDMVNTYHHQAVAIIGDGRRAKILATEPNTEVIESVIWGDDVLGVQFHPEWLGDEKRTYFFNAIEKWVQGEPLVLTSKTKKVKKETPFGDATVRLINGWRAANTTEEE